MWCMEILGPHTRFHGDRVRPPAFRSALDDADPAATPSSWALGLRSRVQHGGLMCPRPDTALRPEAPEQGAAPGAPVPGTQVR